MKLKCFIYQSIKDLLNLKIILNSYLKVVDLVYSGNLL